MPPRLTAQEARLVLFGLLVAIVLYLFLVQRVFAFVPDDAFITYRYAANVADGYGPVFNRGAPPADHTEGYSCPLFMLFVALLIKLPLGIDLLFRVKFLGVVCAIGTLILVQRLAARLGLPVWAQALSPILLAAHASFVVTSIDGMESIFAVFCMTLAVYLFVSRWQVDRANSAPETATRDIRTPAAWAFAACALLRPEALVLGLLAMGLMALTPFVPLARKRRWALVFLGVAGAWFLFRHAYYGAWMPNTFFAKQVPLEYGLMKGGAYLARTFFYQLQDRWYCYALAAGWWMLVLGGLISDRLRERSGWLLPLLVGGQMLFVLRSGGDWMGGWRYMMPVTPLLMLLCVIGMADLADTLIRRLHTPGVVISRLLTGALAVVLLATSLFGNRDFQAVPYEGYRSWASAGFTFDREKLLRDGILGPQVELSRWLKATTRPRAAIVYTEMGYAPYLSPELWFLDADGLTDHGVATLPNVNHEQIGVKDNYTSPDSLVGKYLFTERKPAYFLMGYRQKSGSPVEARPDLNNEYVLAESHVTGKTDTGDDIVMALWQKK